MKPVSAAFSVLCLIASAACGESAARSGMASDKLVTRIVPVPHCFNAAMQDEAFDWLDGALGVTRR